jgi:hypothetical protein
MTIPGGFVAGNVLTAADMNLLPAGAQSCTVNTAGVLTAITTEAALFTQAATGVTGRNYRITVKVGLATKDTNTGTLTVRLKNGATEYGRWQLSGSAGGAGTPYMVIFTTLPAGANTLTVTCESDTATGTFSNGNGGFILVEDIGPT